MKRPLAAATAPILAVVLSALPAPAPEARAASGPTEGSSTASEWAVLEERAGDGEQCLVCSQPIYGAEIVEIRYKGRTFHVAASMLEDFAVAPGTYFTKLQARSALFDERAVEPRQTTRGWLYLGSYLVVGLVFAALCGYLAVGKALGPVPWFFAGLVGNVAALALLWIVPRGDAAALPAGIPSGLAKVPATRAPVACRACGELAHPAATACSGCGARLDPRIEAETARI